jgi:hypothetical protein
MGVTSVCHALAHPSSTWSPLESRNGRLTAGLRVYAGDINLAFVSIDKAVWALVARDAARGLDLPSSIQLALYHVFESWVGGAAPAGLKGDSIPAGSTKRVTAAVGEGSAAVRSVHDYLSVRSLRRCISEHR